MTKNNFLFFFRINVNTSKPEPNFNNIDIDTLVSLKSKVDDQLNPYKPTRQWSKEVVNVPHVTGGVVTRAPDLQGEAEICLPYAYYLLFPFLK